MLHRTNSKHGLMKITSSNKSGGPEGVRMSKLNTMKKKIDEMKRNVKKQPSSLTTVLLLLYLHG